MRSYNLFRRKGGEELLCAVPEDRAVPRFVDAERWSYGGKLEERGGRPIGFDDRAASAAIRFNGFYLFQSADVPHRRG